MVGSMDLDPALPMETVDQATLSMLDCDETPPFPDETVCFHGFGAPSEIPSEDNMWEPVSEKPLLVLLEEDKAYCGPKITICACFLTSKTFEDLKQRKMDVLDKLSGVTNVWVHRKTVMRDLLKTYENSREITQQLVTFSFHGEVGMDLDGLKREAYSLFWKQVLEDYFDGSSTFVPRVSPEIEESTMRTLGRIISHQYVLTGIFPVHINRAFMVAMLCGRQAVSDEDLIGDFLEYISENESQELKAIPAQSDQGELSGESCEFLLDFFSDYQVTKRPSASNLKSTLVQVAKNELLSKPAMAMDEKTELDQIMEDYLEQKEDQARESEKAAEESRDNAAKHKATAEDMRNRAMEPLSEAKKRARSDLPKK
ncbi:hypothetical protein AWC38_SpisGene23160 [Stylophora pistillata]|uniref:Uncharacterized protein n=1 Tax=Stylophora pistillata TaxID=50429 RepID=A0A2B4R8V8_STYPI|nr:hypothetical protein AWC38_SpisGene23160 [Stylophora pistillata]